MRKHPDAVARSAAVAEITRKKRKDGSRVYQRDKIRRNQQISGPRLSLHPTSHPSIFLLSAPSGDSSRGPSRHIQESPRPEPFDRSCRRATSLGPPGQKRGANLAWKFPREWYFFYSAQRPGRQLLRFFRHFFGSCRAARGGFDEKLL